MSSANSSASGKREDLKKNSLFLMQNKKSNYVYGIRRMNQKLLRKQQQQDTLTG
jgi:hypothetical protein